MRENFEDNLIAGVWKDIVMEASEDGESGEDEDDDDAVSYGSEDYRENSSDDFSGSDDYSESDDSDADPEDDLSEAGMSWDELDKQAEEEDRKLAARRGTEKQGQGPMPQQRGGQAGGRRR